MRKIFFFCGIIFVSPLLIPFWLTTEKELIVSDVNRWQDCLSWDKRNIIIQLLALLKEAKEFRNLYYFRLFKGNFWGRLLMYLLKTIYRDCPYFFLDNSCNIGAWIIYSAWF